MGQPGLVDQGRGFWASPGERLQMPFALAVTSDQYWKALDVFWPAEEKQLSPEFCLRLLIFNCSLTCKKLSYFRCDSSAFSSAPEPLTRLHWHRSQKSLVMAYVPPVPRRTEMKTTTFKASRWTESQSRANETFTHGIYPKQDSISHTATFSIK